MSDVVRMADVDLPEPPGDLERLAAGDVEAQPGAVVFPSHTEPYKVACQIQQQRFTTREGLTTLVYWRGDWWQYAGTHWTRPEGMAGRDDSLPIKLELYRLLANAVYEVTTNNDGGERVTVRKPWNPNRARVGNVIEPLKAEANAEIPDTMDAPCFLAGRELPGAPGDYVPMANGLFNWRRRELVGHTPALFTGYSLPFEYDPRAAAPRWESYLADMLEHDPKAILMLQEFLGYVISGRMDLHKGLLLVGPPRGGKSTFLNVVSALVGTVNVLSTDLDTLAGEFGAESLVGKQLIVVPEFSGLNPASNPKVTRFIKSVTGEDDVTVNRKGRTHWHGRLPGRLILASNEYPRFNDPSGAIATRFMSVKLVKSYRDKPDRTLEPALLAELPGILNWALDGLERLEHNREFTIPDTMAEMNRTIEELAAPIKQFGSECLEFTGDLADMVGTKDVFHVFRSWHQDNASGRVPSRATMVNQLQAQYPELVETNQRLEQPLRPGGPLRERVFKGVRLTVTGYFT